MKWDAVLATHLSVMPRAIKVDGITDKCVARTASHFICKSVAPFPLSFGQRYAFWSFFVILFHSNGFLFWLLFWLTRQGQTMHIPLTRLVFWGVKDRYFRKLAQTDNLCLRERAYVNFSKSPWNTSLFCHSLGVAVRCDAPWIRHGFILLKNKRAEKPSIAHGTRFTYCCVHRAFLR